MSLRSRRTDHKSVITPWKKLVTDAKDHKSDAHQILLDGFKRFDARARYFNSLPFLGDDNLIAELLPILSELQTVIDRINTSGGRSFAALLGLINSNPDDSLEVKLGLNEKEAADIREVFSFVKEYFFVCTQFASKQFLIEDKKSGNKIVDPEVTAELFGIGKIFLIKPKRKPTSSDQLKLPPNCYIWVDNKLFYFFKPNTPIEITIPESKAIDLFNPMEEGILSDSALDEINKLTHHSPQKLDINPTDLATSFAESTSATALKQFYADREEKRQELCTEFKKIDTALKDYLKPPLTQPVIAFLIEHPNVKKADLYQETTPKEVQRFFQSTSQQLRYFADEFKVIDDSTATPSDKQRQKGEIIKARYAGHVRDDEAYDKAAELLFADKTRPTLTELFDAKREAGTREHLITLLPIHHQKVVETYISEVEKKDIAHVLGIFSKLKTLPTKENQPAITHQDNITSILNGKITSPQEWPDPTIRTKSKFRLFMEGFSKRQKVAGLISLLVFLLGVTIVTCGATIPFIFAGAGGAAYWAAAGAITAYAATILGLVGISQNQYVQERYSQLSTAKKFGYSFAASAFIVGLGLVTGGLAFGVIAGFGFVAAVKTIAVILGGTHHIAVGVTAQAAAVLPVAAGTHLAVRPSNNARMHKALGATNETRSRISSLSSSQYSSGYESDLPSPSRKASDPVYQHLADETSLREVKQRDPAYSPLRKTSSAS